MLALTSKNLMFILLILLPRALILTFDQYGLWFDIKLVSAPIIQHSIESTYGR